MILSQDESIPSAYPTAGATLIPDEVWQRIEAFIAYRWNERPVTWIVEGPGDWLPPLTPYTVDTAERWADGWETVTLDKAPLGLHLEAGTYRITATAGSTDDPPAAVKQAAIRLAEYLADQWRANNAANSYRVNLGSGMSYETERPTAWAGKALFYSGAADLLRPYRKP